MVDVVSFYRLVWPIWRTLTMFMVLCRFVPIWVCVGEIFVKVVGNYSVNSAVNEVFKSPTLLYFKSTDWTVQFHGVCTSCELAHLSSRPSLWYSVKKIYLSEKTEPRGTPAYFECSHGASWRCSLYRVQHGHYLPDYIKCIPALISTRNTCSRCCHDG